VLAVEAAAETAVPRLQVPLLELLPPLTLPVFAPNYRQPLLLQVDPS
jgi:hypothetical protein